MKSLKKQSRALLWLMVGCAALNANAAGVTVEFKNGTNNVSNEQIYILGMGKTIGDEKPCLIKFTNGVGACTPLSATTKAADFAIPMPMGSVTLPEIVSGRIYMSVGYPVDLYVKNDGGVFKIIEPDSFKLKDSNYYVLYDKFEYSLDGTGLFANPTAVDFFSLPIGLELNTSGTKGKFTKAGFTTSRKEVTDKVKGILNQDPWSKLVLTYPTPDNVLRVVAPAKAMYRESNPNHYFPNTFLQNAAYNYIDKLWANYAQGSANYLLVELSKGNIISGQTTGNAFHFSNGEVLMKPSTSQPFFAGDGDTFAHDNGTNKATIVRELTAASEVGVLPRPGKTLLKFKNDAGDKISCDQMKALNPQATCDSADNAYVYYQANPAWGGTGPWYDLYSKALHSFGETQPIYTFAYDDALAQDGTITLGAVDVPGSKLVVTLGDMTGTTIPSFGGDSTVYDVAFEIGAKNIIKYMSADGGEKTLTANGNASVKSPFQVSFCDAQGNKQTTNVYFKPAMVRPYVEGADGIILNVDQRRIIFPGLDVGCRNN